MVTISQSQLAPFLDELSLWKPLYFISHPLKSALYLLYKSTYYVRSLGSLGRFQLLEWIQIKEYNFEYFCIMRSFVSVWQLLAPQFDLLFWRNPCLMGSCPRNWGRSDLCPINLRWKPFQPLCAPCHQAFKNAPFKNSKKLNAVFSHCYFHS